MTASTTAAIMVSAATVDLFREVDIHIHFVQFDVQASDGVITGLAFEQAVRPANRSSTAQTFGAV